MKDSVQFTYFYTKLILVATILGAILAASLTVIFGVNQNKPFEAPHGGLQYPVSLTSMASGCGDVFFNPPFETNYGVIPEKFWEAHTGEEDVYIPSHSMAVPVFGYMDAEPFDDKQIRFYDQSEFYDQGDAFEEKELIESLSKEKLLRTMYDKNILVIWYTSDISSSDFIDLESYAKKFEGKVLVLPWLKKNGAFVGSRKIGYASWGVSQTCEYFNEETVDEFKLFVKEHPIVKPEVLPEAQINNQGMLFPITNNKK